MAHRLTPVQLRQIARLREDGHSLTAIAAKLGIDRHTVARKLNSHDGTNDRVAPATLAPADLLRLQTLARAVRGLTCGGCAEPFVTLTSVACGLCPHCGTTWQIRPRQS